MHPETVVLAVGTQLRTCSRLPGAAVFADDPPTLSVVGACGGSTLARPSGLGAPRQRDRSGFGGVAENHGSAPIVAYPSRACGLLST